MEDMISYMDDTSTITAPPYAELWADAINETYADGAAESLVYLCQFDAEEDEKAPDDEDMIATIRRVLGKAANALRCGEPATFTGAELDLVRHLMPAHEVHQSGAVRWVLHNYGEASA